MSIGCAVGLPCSRRIGRPSIASVFDSRYANLSDTLLIAVSQSGRSPDLLTSVRAHRDAGASVVALVNDTSSPLAEIADITLPLHAGPELSVAATKSCIASMVVFAAIAAAWSDDTGLAYALDQLPQNLRDAFRLDWSSALPSLVRASSLFVIGRGYGYGVAQEMALKLKETCALRAESFSSAEVRHGPMAIVRNEFPILALATSDTSGISVRELSEALSARGAEALLADTVAQAQLPAIPFHPAFEPLLMLSSFYRFADRLAKVRELDPDKPPSLAKITQTV